MTVIHHTFGPLADRTQRGLAFKLLFQPWKWQEGPAREELRTKLAQHFGMQAFLFANGREGLLALLRSLKLSTDGEVIVQGYTCVVVPNAIEAAGCTTIYADIERDTLNLDCDAVEAAITPKTRAVICQHTFGIPSDTTRLREICDKHSLILIEDCAHVIPDNKGPSSIGKHGDAVLLSFGRDKAISGVTGGAVLCADKDLALLLKREEERAGHVPVFTIKRLLLYPLLYGMSMPLYGLGIGKALLALAGKLKLLVPVVTAAEKHGRMRATLRKLPNACAQLALAQWAQLQQMNDHRRMLTRFYLQIAISREWAKPDSKGDSALPSAIEHDLPLQKFPLFVAGARGIRAALKQKNIYLDDGWTGCVVCPSSVDGKDAGYEQGTDPVAEEACTAILSLPTHPSTSMKQAQKLVDLLDPMFKKARSSPS